MMRHDPALRTQAVRRGGILLEVLISIALFVGAASVVLGVTGNVVSRQDVTLRQQQALDLAHSLLASLDTGLITIAEIREGLPRQLGSIQDFGEQINDHMDRGLPGWLTSIQTQRTEFAGLSLVEITVREDLPGSGGLALGGLNDAGNADGPIVVTVRQLVRLREQDPEAWEIDEMMQDLPESTSSSSRDEPEGTS